MSWLRKMFCSHDWVLVKHQIGVRLAILTVHCTKCDALEDHLFKVSAKCDVREPIDIFGRPH